MIQIGDRVVVGSRIGAKMIGGVVVDIIPENEYRKAIYRVRFDAKCSEDVTITPSPNECWVDANLILSKG